MEWFCLVGDENYTDSMLRDQWFQGQMCHRWTHPECSKGDDTYLCHLCDPDSD